MSMTAHSGLRNHGIIQGEIKQAAQKGILDFEVWSALVIYTWDTSI